MEESNYVSIWLGTFESEEELRTYTDERDGENSILESLFWIDYNIEYAELDFQEVSFNKNVSSFESLFKNISYSKSFIEGIKEVDLDLNRKKINSVICIYRYKYEMSVLQTPNTLFLGNFIFDEYSEPI